MYLLYHYSLHKDVILICYSDEIKRLCYNRLYFERKWKGNEKIWGIQIQKEWFKEL